MTEGTHAPPPRDPSRVPERLDGPALLRAVDRLSAIAGRGADLALVAICAMVTYEALARYVLHAPTRWTSDVATTLLLWLTFVAMAQSLRQRRMIRITALIGGRSPTAARLIELFSLVVIGGFSAMAVWLCWGEMLESIAMGRRTASMLQLPQWIVEAPVVIGFALLALQAFADAARLWLRPAPDFGHGDAGDLPGERDTA
ncbi:TRAP-type C4-dicarboxylate transport system permease small subunit [Rhodovulum visakhapatnamense]|uniref:TRAP transporter small permease protein n=1 Tax=Rhodovulum visakhapatnamense TaxID=364297 RepID=A0A4R8G4L8_9RHOB|nr:TRAP-type C4-dicarboxylate transport system permease small subunit [Rhodovulum visakhapatnamense]